MSHKDSSLKIEENMDIFAYLLVDAILNRVEKTGMNDEIEGSNNIDMTVDNGDNKDLKVKQYDSARKEDSKIIDITKSDNTSKGILDIADTPDVAVWNKSVQIKSDDTNQLKHSKERDNGETQTTGFGFRKGRRKEGDNK